MPRWLGYVKEHNVVLLGMSMSHKPSRIFETEIVVEKRKQLQNTMRTHVV